MSAGKETRRTDTVLTLPTEGAADALAPWRTIETRPKPTKVVRRLGTSWLKRKACRPKKFCDQQVVCEPFCGSDETFVMFSSVGFQRQLWKLVRKSCPPPPPP